MMQDLNGKQKQTEIIREWYQLYNQYETYGNRYYEIKKLEKVITTVFHKNYKLVLIERIQKYEDVFTVLVLLGQNT
jgi:hypothetical protein